VRALPSLEGIQPIEFSLHFGFCLQFPHLPLTLAVETVEKVPFQKSVFEKWERNTEKCLVFGLPHNISATFRRFLSLLWETFMSIFQTRGFSTVSLGFVDNEKIMFIMNLIL
jgi:hypothetical protein